MKIFLLILFIFCFTFVEASNNRLAIPPNTAEIDQEKIVTDPNTGDRLVSNQVLLAFKDHVQSTEQLKVLESIGGKIVGGMPALEIYQVAFENRDASLDRLQTVKDLLSINEDVLFVLPRKIQSGNRRFIEFENDENVIARKGSLTLTTATKKSDIHKMHRIEDIINFHNPALSGCLEKTARINSNFHGSVIFRIEISNLGEVISASVVNVSQNIDKKLVSCFLKKIRKWNDFPSHSNANFLTVDFTFDF